MSDFIGEIGRIEGSIFKIGIGYMGDSQLSSLQDRWCHYPRWPTVEEGQMAVTVNLQKLNGRSCGF